MNKNSSVLNQQRYHSSTLIQVNNCNRRLIKKMNYLTLRIVIKCANLHHDFQPILLCTFVIPGRVFTLFDQGA